MSNNLNSSNNSNNNSMPVTTVDVDNIIKRLLDGNPVRLLLSSI